MIDGHRFESSRRGLLCFDRFVRHANLLMARRRQNSSIETVEGEDDVMLRYVKQARLRVRTLLNCCSPNRLLPPPHSVPPIPTIERSIKRDCPRQPLMQAPSPPAPPFHAAPFP